MEYIVIDMVNGDMFTSEHDTAADAIADAQNQWDRLTDHDRNRRDAFYVLQSVNPDPDAVNHYDGDAIKTYK